MILKLISFFVPITRKIKSEHSGDLELTLIEGKKLLDTTHANYSYGSLQRVLEFAIRKIDLSHLKNVLVLGLGGGSVIKSLREVFNYELGIVAVEIDPVIIKIANEEFGVLPDYRTEIVCEDAYEYVKISKKFDLIIIDLFIDNKIPKKFVEVEFWKNLLSNVNENGFIIFNTINESSQALERIKNQLRREFAIKEYGNVEKVNHLLIARKK